MDVEQNINKYAKYNSSFYNCISNRLIKQKSNKKKVKVACRLLVLPKIKSEIENCALLVGDLIVFLPQQENVFKVNSSSMNKFKYITSLSYNKNLQLIDVNMARKNGIPDKSQELVLKLRSLGDKDCYNLGNYIEAWTEKVKKQQNQSSNNQFTNSELKFQDLLFQPVQNYRHNLEQFFCSYMRNTQGIAQYIQRFYHNPITRELILYSCSYSNELIKILGKNQEIMLSKLQKYGLIDFLHPSSVVRFMYCCFHDYFNNVEDSQIRDIDLITVEGFKVPCHIVRSFISGVPNEDGYFEIYHLYQIHVEPHNLIQLNVLRNSTQSYNNVTKFLSQIIFQSPLNNSIQSFQNIQELTSNVKEENQ